jgi:putative SOS response-associated peptidase YedK
MGGGTRYSANVTKGPSWAVVECILNQSMCGRYYSLFDKQQVAEHFHVRRTADNVGIIVPNWNVAPGDPQPVIRRSRETGERELVMMLWGVVSVSRRANARITSPYRGEHGEV